eukprot:TRINITY_DN13237_c0_g1_i2.p1 TRINITY_DN13237_c0_g1~~TRINITY_DN13237_c0_g1_i2.p1  ORF type:complete len:700 (+),score=111.81 TRINITY_DN13237_c0_g1_i2:165-2264(+)
MASPLGSPTARSESDSALPPLPPPPTPPPITGSSPSSSSSAAPSTLALRRLRHDFEALQRTRNPQITVRPSQARILQWHFVLHNLPTPYHGGCYHGIILFPAEYPHSPPTILMTTPSGRLETGKRLCLSMTDFHPESWNPAWSVETILVGLLSFFLCDTEKGVGAIKATADRRRRLAAASWNFNNHDADFRELFPEFAEMPAADEAAEKRTPEQQKDDVELETIDTPTTSATCAVNSGKAEQPAPAAEGSQDAGRDDARGSWLSGFDGGGGRPEAAAGGRHQEMVTGSVVEGPSECWICRDDRNREPLIQPCACRGSMSCVHASCVEQWIAHHRRSAVHDEPPKCSVCHQPYVGSELRPGVSGYARHLACGGVQWLARLLLLLILLVFYQGAALPTTKMPFGARIAFIGAFSLAAGYKVFVLTVSLPIHRPPPHSRCLRLFFESDFKQLTIHFAESYATVAVLGMWCAMDSLPLEYFLPFLLLACLPCAKLCIRQSLEDCLHGAAVILIVAIRCPFDLLIYFVKLAYRNPRVVFHPLGCAPQMVVAIVELPLCLALQSNVVPVAVWTAHSVFLLAGIVEKLIVKKLQWRTGTFWWIAWQVSFLTTYVVLMLCTFSEGLGAPGNQDQVVVAVSIVWLVLVSGLTLTTNWDTVVTNYRNWQRRHGTFTLQVGPAAGAANQADASPQRGGSRVAPAPLDDVA